MKGYILNKTSDLIEVHSLIYLCKKAMEFDEKLKVFLKDCAFVNQFYIETRYPADIPTELSKDEANECIEITEKILKFIIL